VRALVADPLACRRLVALTAGDVRAAICRWQAEDMSVATVSARWLVLRSAISWAVGEGVLRANSLAGMRGPPRSEPRRHHTAVEVRRLLRTAEAAVKPARVVVFLHTAAEADLDHLHDLGVEVNDASGTVRTDMETSTAGC